jgi:hypothetical protein
MWFDDGDDDKKAKSDKPDEGGAEAGDYKPPEDLPVPGESKGIESSQLG